MRLRVFAAASAAGLDVVLALFGGADSSPTEARSSDTADDSADEPDSTVTAEYEVLPGTQPSSSESAFRQTDVTLTCGWHGTCYDPPKTATAGDGIDLRANPGDPVYGAFRAKRVSQDPTIRAVVRHVGAALLPSTSSCLRVVVDIHDSQRNRVGRVEYVHTIGKGTVEVGQPVPLPSSNQDVALTKVATVASITDERDDVTDFTQPYLPPSPPVYVALAGAGDGAVNGKVAAQVATIQADHLSGSGATLREYARAPELVAAILSGEVDAALVDGAFAGDSLAASGGRLTLVGPEVLLDSGVGVGIREGDHPLQGGLYT